MANGTRTCRTGAGGGALRAFVSALADGRYHRFIGRFHTLRRAVSAIRGILDVKSAPVVDGKTDSRIYGWAEALQLRGISAGPALDDDTVDAIRSYAESARCRLPATGEEFQLDELRQGFTPEGQPAAVADVVDPGSCPAVSLVSQDAALFATARRFLGYRPRRVVPRLFWSPVIAADDDTRQAAGQTVDYHYDIEACRSLYAYFYIVGGDERSGAHVVVEGSNHTKPLRMIANRCFQPEERVVGHYGHKKVRVVSGEPGFCFLEDPACFHKALPPVDGPRLCLQIRYS